MMDSTHTTANIDLLAESTAEETLRREKTSRSNRNVQAFFLFGFYAAMMLAAYGVLQFLKVGLSTAELEMKIRNAVALA